MTDCLIMRYTSMLIESLKCILDSKSHCCSSSAINVQKTSKYSNLLLHSNYVLHTNSLNTSSHLEHILNTSTSSTFHIFLHSLLFKASMPLRINYIELITAVLMPYVILIMLFNKVYLAFDITQT